MCIISFFKQNDEVLLTHNRDESIYRSASFDVEERFWEGNIYFSPVDYEKDGTWIFHSEDYIACILNGGKKKPVSIKSSYRRSRGLILLDLMKYNSAEEFCDTENLSAIAAFTIFVYHRKKNKIHFIFWDETKLEINDLSDKNFVFRASSTLYSSEKMRDLENIFLKFNFSSSEDIFNLHHQIKMNDGEIESGKATTSITQIHAKAGKISMKYCPFLSK